jgi:lipoyl-dependent peroxiredoxin subunit C
VRSRLTSGREDAPLPLTIAGPGDSWTVLFFYPRDFTFVCPTELRAFAELEEAFDAEDATVIAASTDSWHVHRAWLETSPGLTVIDYPVCAGRSSSTPAGSSAT